MQVPRAMTICRYLRQLMSATENPCFPCSQAECLYHPSQGRQCIRNIDLPDYWGCCLNGQLRHVPLAA